MAGWRGEECAALLTTRCSAVICLHPQPGSIQSECQGWERGRIELLQHINASPFGATDPIFNRDISFYFFNLPFIKALVGLGFWLLGVSLIGAAVSYAVSSGAVYTTLDRLRDQGLVSSWVGEPTSERGGRRKRLYSLQPAGVECLGEAVRIFRSMSSGLLARLDRRLAEGSGGDV